MTDLHDAGDLEDLYGPLYKYADRKRGERITYCDGATTHTGTIIWITAPGDIAGQHVPMQYICEPDRGGMPDIVYRSDVVE